MDGAAIVLVEDTNARGIFLFLHLQNGKGINTNYVFVLAKKMENKGPKFQIC